MRVKNVIILCMLFMLLGVTTTFAANWQDEGVPVQPTQGDGTFEIYTAEELAWVAMKVNSGTTFEGYTINIMNDIDLTGKEWTPIGGWNGTENDDSKKFSGNFDGNNFTIKNMQIGTKNKYAEYNYTGLFGYVYYSESIITNISLNNVTVYSNGNYTGGLAGYAKANILNCSVTGNIFGKSSVGGLIGYSWSHVKNCFTCGNIDGNSRLGGLIGESLLNIENCFSTSNVTGSGRYIGGLVGINGHYIANSYAIGNVTSREDIGGLVAVNSGDICNCYWDIDAVHTENGIKLEDSKKSGVISSRNNAEKIFSKTNKELKSSEFADLLNEYITSDEALCSWTIDMNANNGYPVFKEITDSDFFWLGNAKEPMLINEKIYQISSAEELAWISQQVMNGETFAGYTFYLMNDIDLSGKQWTPIGGWNGVNSDANYYFSGIFNGNGHIINGLIIGSEKYPRKYEYNGFFGYNKTANILNIELKNILINASNYTGGIIGKVFLNTSISNCYVTGRITAAKYSGGIIGGTEDTGFCDVMITNSYSDIDVSSSEGYVGGICGSVGYRSGITNCYSTGNVSGPTFVGAIAGYSENNSNCYWNSDCTLSIDGLEMTGVNKKGVASGTDNTIAKSLAELKEQDTYEKWDFDDVWGISENFNNGLPYLKWQLQNTEAVPIESITLNKTEVSLTPNSTINLKATISPSNAIDMSLTWSSDNTSVAVVDKYGAVTAKADGTAIITVKNGDVSAQCTVTVATPDSIVCNISEMAIKTTAGEKLSKIPKESFIAEINVNAIKDTDEVGYIIVGAYDENGVLVDISYVYADINIMHNSKIGVLVRNNGNVAKVKAFVWNGWDNMLPLANSIEAV